MACLSIYWAVFLHVERNFSSLVVYVVDFDGQAAPYNTSGIKPIVGPTIVKMAQDLVRSGDPNPGYEWPTAEEFEYDPIQVRKAVFEWDAWAAIIINPNATAMLQSAIEQGNKWYISK